MTKLAIIFLNEKEKMFGIYVFFVHIEIILRKSREKHLALEGINLLCLAWYLGSEVGRLPGRNCLFRQECQPAGTRLTTRPPQAHRPSVGGSPVPSCKY